MAPRRATLVRRRTDLAAECDSSLAAGLDLSPEHPLQLLHPPLDLLLQLREVGEDLLRRAMLDRLVHHLLVAVEREVVALRCDVGLRHAEALRRARALALGVVALRPARKSVG